MACLFVCLLDCEVLELLAKFDERSGWSETVVEQATNTRKAAESHRSCLLIFLAFFVPSLAEHIDKIRSWHSKIYQNATADQTQS